MLIGKFITFEGLDGSGKTTIISKLKHYFYDINLKDSIVYDREPGSNPISESIREIILDDKYPKMDCRTEVLLYAAARRQHVIDNILPALKNNKLVISDRFVDSSIAYQGGGRNINIESIKIINQFATGNLNPDLTIYLDVDPTIGLYRIQRNRRSEMNRLDNENLLFYKKVRNTYLRIAKTDFHRFKVVNANQPIHDVFKEVLCIIKNFFNENHLLIF